MPAIVRSGRPPCRRLGGRTRVVWSSRRAPRKPARGRYPRADPRVRSVSAMDTSASSAASSGRCPFPELWLFPGRGGSRRPAVGGRRRDRGRGRSGAAGRLAGGAEAYRHAPARSADYVLLAIGVVALLGRRRYPVPVLAIALAAAVAEAAVGGSRPGVPVAWIVLIAAFINAVVYRKRAAAIASLVIGYLVSVWPPWLIGSRGSYLGGRRARAAGRADHLAVGRGADPGAEPAGRRGQPAAARRRHGAGQARSAWPSRGTCTTFSRTTSR